MSEPTKRSGALGVGLAVAVGVVSRLTLARVASMSPKAGPGG
jgi:hypothetical protein